MALLEARPYRPFKSSEEYLEAMKEDLAEWLNTLYPELLINTENFLDCLDTGVALCKHANNVRQAAEDYLARRHARNRSMTRSMTSGLTGPILAMGNVHYLPAAKSATFFARDNVSNFITWCRKSLRIIECLLFETDDLIMRKNEKHVILCLLEVARRGAKFGMLAPMLVQMEREIDREIAADIKASGVFTLTRSGGIDTIEMGTDSSTIDEVDYSDSSSDSECEDGHSDGRMLVYGPQPQIITNDLKSLDEMVRDLVEKCICQSQFPMVRVSEGKYRIGDTKVLIFVRILRSHVMVRVGGGWDTLSHYLDKHDPCRCKAQHRPSLSARVVPRSSNQTNGIELHKAQVIYERSPPATRKCMTNFNNQSASQNQSQAVAPSTTTNYGFSLAPKLRSRSPTPQRKFLNQLNLNSAAENGGTPVNGGDKFVPTVGKNKLTSPSITRRSISPGPKRFLDMRKKQNSLDSFTNSKKLIANCADAGHNLHEQLEDLSLTLPDGGGGGGGGKEPLKNANAGDNGSDNGSEISDEGYRSLGILQANARGRVPPPFAQNSHLPVPFVAPSNASSPEEERSASLKTKYEHDDVDDGPQSLPALLPSNSSGRRNPPENRFEHFGVFVTDDNITVDVERPSDADKSPRIVGAVQNAGGAKLPSGAPAQQRRRSVDNSMYRGSLQDLSVRSGLPVLNRRIPQYRSMRKSLEPIQSKESAAAGTAGVRPTNKAAPRNVNNTWSGQSAANGRKRPTIKADTFAPTERPRNVAGGMKTCTLYDSNGRRVKGCTSSLNTSPVKNNSASPLAQQLLEAANSAKNDAQILAKMKTLLSQYSSSNQKAYSSKVNNKDSLYEDFTSAWVHNNGNFERRNSCSPPTKTLSKRSSAASSAESTQSRDLSVIVAPRRERGNSKIPAPLQQKSELY